MFWTGAAAVGRRGGAGPTISKEQPSMDLTERAAEAWRNKQAEDEHRQEMEDLRWARQDRQDRHRQAGLIEAWFDTELGCDVRVDPDTLLYRRGGHEATVEADGLAFNVKVQSSDSIDVLYQGRTLSAFGDQTALVVLGRILADPHPPHPVGQNMAVGEQITTV